MSAPLTGVKVDSTCYAPCGKWTAAADERVGQ
jgi:hypothetical protein